jgi:hypothetical protein
MRVRQAQTGPSGAFLRRLRNALALMSAAACLSACSMDSAFNPAPSAALAPAIPNEALVGRWGLAAYHRDTDRDRTEKEARAQCANPYVIGKGQNGGVMMHLADEKELQELTVKTAADGRTYIGPGGPAGEAVDQEVISYDPNLLLTRWVDPETAERYGTMVYTRCGAPAAKPAPKPKAA